MNLARKLLQLVLDLPQSDDLVAVINQFIEPLNRELHPIKLSFSKNDNDETETKIPITTDTRHFGFIHIQNDKPLTNETKALLEDSLQMLAMVMERRTLLKKHNLPEEPDKRWQSAIDVTGDGVWDWDLKTNKVFFSDQWKTQLGYTPSEISNELAEWKKRVHPSDLEKALNEVNRHLNGYSSSYSSEHRLKCSDGSYKWILDRGKVIEHDENGAPKRFIGTHTDITERKLFEIELEETRFGIENAQIGVFQIEEDGIITYANRFAALSLGYTREEIKGMSLFTIDPNFNSNNSRQHRKNIQTRGSGTITTVHKHKNGSEIPVEVTITYFTFREKTLSFSFVKDISEQINAEESLCESESRFRLLAESAPIGILISDKQENTLYTNKRFYDLFGYSKEDFKSVSEWWLLAYPDEKFREHVQKEWVKMLNKAKKGTSKPKSVEFPVCCKDGTVKHIEFRLASTEQLNFIILSDVSEKHRSVEALRKIEWMLSKKAPPVLDDKDWIVPAYGDLTVLNTSRLILDSVGKTMLQDISKDFMGLLDSSSAIYEKNGDYALGIFTSGWCRFMDQASRDLCKTGDNQRALESGKWHCHESCWKDASLKAIETKKPVDIECAGGIHLYALPILTKNSAIGAINFGYGDPPKETKKLAELAEKYRVPLEKLEKLSHEYESRPQYIIDLAKERLEYSANLIGEIVTRKTTEKKLKQLNNELEQIVAEKTTELHERIKELERFHDATIEREFRIKELRDEIEHLKRESNA